MVEHKTIAVVTEEHAFAEWITPLLAQAGCPEAKLLSDDGDLSNLAREYAVIICRYRPQFKERLVRLACETDVTIIALCDKTAPVAGEAVDGFYLVPKEQLCTDIIRMALDRARYRRQSNYRDSRSEDELFMNFRGVFMNSPLPMWIFDRETLQFLRVNHAATIEYGYTEEEFLSMTILDIRPKNERRHVIQHLSGKRPREIWRHQRKDGSVFHVHVKSHPIRTGNTNATLIAAINIEERIQAEREKQELFEALQRQKDIYDELLASMNEVVWRTSVDDFKLTYTNPACERIFGYKPEEMMADPSIFFNSIYPEDREAFGDSMNEALTMGKTEKQFRVIHKSGAIKHVLGNAVLIEDSKGRKSLNGLTVDITDLVEAQEEIKRGAAEKNRILESITDGFFAIDENWHINFINSASEEMFNIRKESVVGRNVFEVFPRLPSTDWPETLNRVWESRETAHLSFYSDLAKRWLSVSIYPSDAGVTVFLKDISEERELQEAIRNSERKLRTIINSTEDGIWSVDTELKLLTFNDSFARVCQLVTGDLPETGKMSPLLRQADSEVLLQQYKKAFQGEVVTRIHEIYPSTGPRIVETKYHPIFGDDGKVVGVSCLSRDITEEQRYLAEIELQNKRLKEIAWIQSHRVRSHVAQILGLSQLLEPTAGTSIENQEIVQHMVTAATLLDEAIREIDHNTRTSESVVSR